MQTLFILYPRKEIWWAHVAIKKVNRTIKRSREQEKSTSVERFFWWFICGEGARSDTDQTEQAVGGGGESFT